MSVTFMREIETDFNVDAILELNDSFIESTIQQHYAIQIKNTIDALLDDEEAASNETPKSIQAQLNDVNKNMAAVIDTWLSKLRDKMLTKVSENKEQTIALTGMCFDQYGEGILDSIDVAVNMQAYLR